MPTAGLAAARSRGWPPRPGQLSWPAVGGSSPASMWSRVDFPDPDGPVSAMRAPAGRVRFTPYTATTADEPVPKV